MGYQKLFKIFYGSTVNHFKYLFGAWVLSILFYIHYKLIPECDTIAGNELKKYEEYPELLENMNCDFIHFKV
jgi:hypothetical protein